MENPEFESFERSNGHDEFDNWLQELSLKDRAKILQVITVHKSKVYKLQTDDVG